MSLKNDLVFSFKHVNYHFQRHQNGTGKKDIHYFATSCPTFNLYNFNSLLN